MLGKDFLIKIRRGGEGLISWASSSCNMSQAELVLLSTWITHLLWLYLGMRQGCPRECSLGKSCSIPKLPWRRCFLISVLPVKLAANKLQCPTRWHSLSPEMLQCTAWAYSRLWCQQEAVLSTNVNTMTPKRQAAQERLKDLKKWQPALCLHEKVLILACVSMRLEPIKMVLSDGSPFPLWGEWRSQSCSWCTAWIRRQAKFPWPRMWQMLWQHGLGKAPSNAQSAKCSLSANGEWRTLSKEVKGKENGNLLKKNPWNPTWGLR